jgi:dipeptidyl aminopeptidase/acylaminoacyl peptidase
MSNPARTSFVAAVLAVLLLGGRLTGAEGADRFHLADVFQLQYASDPQVSPDGDWVVYVRHHMDIRKDRRRSSLWLIRADGTDHRAVTPGATDDSSPRWSPDGKRLIYLAESDGTTRLWCRWMDTGQTAELATLTEPAGLAWSPDGRSIAVTQFVPEKRKPFVELPGKPEGAEWAEPFKMIRDLHYRADGKGYRQEGRRHLFVVAADGGPPRQVTRGAFDHDGTPAWTADARALIFSANRHDEGEYDPLNTEVYEVSVADGTVKALTDRQGPDTHPVVSRDGQQIAYLGFDDRRQGYQVTRLYVMNRDGSDKKCLTAKLDRSTQDPLWDADGRGVFCQFDEEGVTKVGRVSLDGAVAVRASGVGGTTLDRPYASGSFSVAGDGTVAFTLTAPEHAAEVAVRRPGAEPRRLTSLSTDFLGRKALGKVEEVRYQSAHDGRAVQGWVVHPPEFDPQKKYPLILEIHGGPFANYGPRFATDMQLYAAAGYVVFYANPRGSTGYGEEFGNLIHHAYPGHDYDDLMSGVDAVVKRSYVDEGNLFVTGGSGGGVLTSWIVGKTNRFRAAVAAKPVINWTSFALTADIYPFFVRYWFPGPPWEHPEHYWKRSPLSLVGNVTTPTMLMTGEADQRTPISESEQFYQALKLRKVDAALVRVPGASHDVGARPSHLMAKAAYVLQWFETHRRTR